MFGRMMPCDFFNDPACFLWGKRLIERRRFMRIEVVRHQYDLLRLWTVPINKVLKTMSKVHVGASVRPLHVSPPCKRSQEHEHVADPVALLGIILATRLAPWPREGGSGFFDLLFTRFISAHQHMRGRIRTMRDFQGVLPGTHKGGSGLGRDTPPFV
jgi:hypothetical protein